MQKTYSSLKRVVNSFYAHCLALCPESAAPLAVLRLGTACILVLQAFSVRNYLYPLVGTYGIIQLELRDPMAARSLPRIEWLVSLGSLIKLSDVQTIYLAFGIYVFLLLLLAAGVFTRKVAFLAWLLHLTFNTAGIASIYGVYEFTHIALFYCFVMPVGDAFSMDTWRRAVNRDKGMQYALSRRILQWHLCVVYFSSGVEKALGRQWWNGEAVWRALMREDVPISFSWFATVPPVAMGLCWSTLILELGYVFFIWHPSTRRIALIGVTLFHLGIGVFLGLWFFSAIMILLNLTAFYSFRKPRFRWAGTPFIALRPIRLR
jgi:hypothetical protein